MPTTSIFYFHNATTAVGGTLPGASTLSGTASSVSVTGAGTNRVMDGSIGVSQQSGSWTTLANQTAQPTFVRRFISEPLGVNNFGSGGLAHGRLFCATQMSSTNSRLEPVPKLWIWRPSDGSIVATLMDQNGGLGSGSSTSETWRFWDTSGTGALTAGTSADGDVLVCELWRSTLTQTHSSGYTNTLYYDGTTDGFAASPAGVVASAGTCLWFDSDANMEAAGSRTATPVEMSSGAPPPRVPYRSQMPTLIAQ